MPLSPGKLATLRAAVLADATAAGYLTAGDMYSLAEYLNTPTDQDAWSPAVLSTAMVEALRIVNYDTLPAGKRDAFRLLLEFGPINATRQAVRKGVEEIFAVAGTYTDAVQAGRMLQACTEKATWGEVALGSTTPAAVAGVTAIRRNHVGRFSVDDAAALQGA